MTEAATRTIVAVTGEDDRYSPIRSRATALAAGGRATVILYDLDAAGMFSSPVPTEWSGEGEKELADDEASDDRLGPDELETAGRSAIAEQVRSMRSVGVDAWGWLPTSKDPDALAGYAARQEASVVLVPPDLGRPSGVEREAGTAVDDAPAGEGPTIPFETVGERPGGPRS
jgi:hypothetical protein